MSTPRYRDAPNRTIEVAGTRFAYRELGPAVGTPVVFLGFLGAVLDDWDPRLVDGLAAHRRVVTFDNRGVGASRGRTPESIEAMATDAIAFVRALGHQQVDLLGFSMGGFVAQEIARREPRLVRRLVLTGTGPAGGAGIDRITRVTLTAMVRGALTFRDARVYLLFPPTRSGREHARAFLIRLRERTGDRDRRLSPLSFRAQLRAISRWARRPEGGAALIGHPTLVANGDADVMVPTINSHRLAASIPGASLVIYPDAGHGGIFQHHAEFVAAVLEFLARRVSAGRSAG